MKKSASVLVISFAILITGCDDSAPLSGGTETPKIAAESASVLTTAKAEGILIYEGGSLNVTVPRVLDHHYTSTGALSVSGTIEAPKSSGRTNGAFIAIPEALEREFSGRTISIRTVISSETGGEAYFAYSTSEVGNSGWMPFTLATEDSVSTFVYKVPEMKAGNGDFIGFNPNGNQLYLKAVMIDIVE